MRKTKRFFTLAESLLSAYLLLEYLELQKAEYQEGKIGQSSNQKTLWESWSQKKQYNKPFLERYYAIRARNLLWLTARAFNETSASYPRILKTDLWNEARKEEAFFVDAAGDLFAIDLSQNICAAAVSRYAQRFSTAQSTITALPFADNSFDLVWDISTIDHIRAPEQAVREYVRVLQPGGVLLLIAENPFCLSFLITKIQALLGQHVPFYGYPHSRLVRACRQSGFVLIESFKTNVHLPTWLVYPLEKRGRLEEINQSRNMFWNFCKKYSVVLARKPSLE